MFFRDYRVWPETRWATGHGGAGHPRRIGGRRAVVATAGLDRRPPPDEWRRLTEPGHAKARPGPPRRVHTWHVGPGLAITAPGRAEPPPVDRSCSSVTGS